MNIEERAELVRLLTKACEVVDVNTIIKDALETHLHNQIIKLIGELEGDGCK